MALSVLTSSCSNVSEDISVYAMDSLSNHGASSVSTSEYSLPDIPRFLIDDSAPKRASVELNGEVFEGEYKYSFAAASNVYLSEFYSLDGAEFSINSNTGKMDYLWISTPNKSGNMTIEQCGELAKKFAGEYIDISKYSYTQEDSESFYSYEFRQYIGDMKTSNLFAINMEPSGKVFSFANYTSPELENIVANSSSGKNADTLSKLQSKEALAKLDDKITGMYKDVCNKNNITQYELTYEIIGKVVVVMNDGRMGIRYAVEADFKRPMPDGTYSGWGEILYFVVC